MSKISTAKEVQSWYIDQAPLSDSYKGGNFYTTLPSFGVRQIDSDFCNKIIGLKNRETGILLKRAIKSNIHLHEKIKENLLLNLKNKMKTL